MAASIHISYRILISPADTFGWPKARCTFPAFVTRSSWRDLAGSRVYTANDMGDSIVIKFTSSSITNTVTPTQRQPRLSRWPRQHQSPPPQQQQQPAGQWRPATLILCHSVLEANATSDFFVAEAFVLDGWSVVVFWLHAFSEHFSFIASFCSRSTLTLLPVSK